MDFQGFCPTHSSVCRAGSFFGGICVDRLCNLKLKAVTPHTPKQNISGILLSTIQIVISSYSQSSVCYKTGIHALNCIKLNFALKFFW